MSNQRFQEHFLSAGILLDSWRCTWHSEKATISNESLFFYDRLIHSITEFAPVPDFCLSACLTIPDGVPPTQQYSTSLSYHAFQLNLFLVHHSHTQILLLPLITENNKKRIYCSSSLTFCVVNINCLTI